MSEEQQTISQMLRAARQERADFLLAPGQQHRRARRRRGLVPLIELLAAREADG